MHAMKDRERKHLRRGRKGCHGRLINKTVFLCLEVGSGTQTKQRWLKGKIVKYGHGRRYKKTFTVPRTGVEKKQGKNMKGKIE